MRKTNRLTLVAIGLLVLWSPAIGQDSLQWQPTLDTARQVAAQTNRLVLIHFWADWCAPCKKMENEVLNQPAVVAAIHAHYVPVKVNRDLFPALCKRYDVTALPSDVLITPEGELVGHFKGVTSAHEYAARLTQVASGWEGQVGNVAQSPVPPPPGRDPYSINRPAPVGNPAEYASGHFPSYGNAAPEQIPAQPPVAAPSSNPPLGLDGYCPVQLADDMQQKRLQWTPGDPRWGVIHRGRTYLFSGPDQQRRFLADPDRYAPVLSGNDIVAAVDRGELVPGRREYGVAFGNSVYLFADEAALGVFSRSPRRYADIALEAIRAEGSRQAMR